MINLIKRTPKATSYAGWVQRIATTVRSILGQAGAELARLNRAGLNAEALAGKSRRDRARAVMAALSRSHRGHHRCC
jgi:hypothetical protein